jgi:hypothetical protein
MTMRKRVTKKNRFFNDINLTADHDVYVGIDVHKVGLGLVSFSGESIFYSSVAVKEKSLKMALLCHPDNNRIGKFFCNKASTLIV